MFQRWARVKVEHTLSYRVFMLQKLNCDSKETTFRPSVIRRFNISHHDKSLAGISLEMLTYSFYRCAFKWNGRKIREGIIIILIIIIIIINRARTSTKILNRLIAGH